MPARIHFQCKQVEIGQFEQVGGLAPGAAQASRTRWPAATSSNSRHVSAGILHRYPAFGETGQGLDRVAVAPVETGVAYW